MGKLVPKVFPSSLNLSRARGLRLAVFHNNGDGYGGAHTPCFSIHQQRRTRHLHHPLHHQHHHLHCHHDLDHLALRALSQDMGCHVAPSHAISFPRMLSNGFDHPDQQLHFCLHRRCRVDFPMGAVLCLCAVVDCRGDGGGLLLRVAVPNVRAPCL